MSNGQEIDAIAHLLPVLPESLVQAARYCSLPHWFDRKLAVAIIEHFVGTESTALFAGLLNMPFVYGHSEGIWQYTVAARSYFCRQVVQDGEILNGICQFLVAHFQHEWDKLFDETRSPRLTSSRMGSELGWKSRQLQWQLAYHWAPVDAAEAVNRLITISEWAGSERRYLADHKLVVDVFHDQEHFLTEYTVERYYIEGRYAYSRQNWQEAEEKFAYVWDRGAHKWLVTASAGHLLAVIRRKKGQQRWIEDAEAILRDCLDICETRIGLSDADAKELASRILNSLGATMIQLGGEERMRDAQQVLRRSLILNQELDHEFGLVQVMNTLATHLVHLGGVENMAEAEALYQEGISISRGSGYARSLSLLQAGMADLIIRRGDREHYQEAESLLRSSLEFSVTHQDPQHQALVLNRLGVLLLLWEDEDRLTEAERYLRRSLELWQSINNPKGQQEALRNLVSVLLRTGRFEEAQVMKHRASMLKA